MDPIAWEERRWVFEYDLHCEDERVSGEHERMLIEATMEIEAPTAVRIHVDSGDGILVAPCAPGCDAGDVLYVNGGEFIDAQLAAGRYVVKAVRSAPGLVSVTASRGY